jgi:hypothetical protein
MFKTKVLLITLFIISGCTKVDSEDNLLNKKNPVGEYGELKKESQLSTFQELFKMPQDFIGKEVSLKGMITEVCPMRGCWINVKDEVNDFQIRVKVTDGKIVFPLSGVGNRVLVEGEFSKLNFSEDQAKQWKIHLAQEKGETLNPDSIIIKDSDLVEYRIIGKGVEIYPS